MESVPFDEKKFKTAFHEREFEWIRARKILPELIFQINANESPQILEKIEQRGWQLLTSPEGKINGNLIKEFYANVVREDKTKAPTFKSYVRGKEVDFSPNALTRVLHLKSPRFDEESYQARIRKPKAKERVHQEEPHQEEYQQGGYSDPANLNMSHLLRAIEDLGMRHMEGQEQILNLQTNWLSQQEAWQKQQMEQQQEHYSRLTQAINQVNERQELQEKHLQELNQRQIAQMKTFNEFSVLNEGRQLHREEFYVNTQAKLNYMTSNMHQLHYAIPTYDEVQKDFVEQEERKVKQQKETLKKKMEDGGFWKKLLGKGKGSGSTSTQERHNEDKQGWEHGHPHEGQVVEFFLVHVFYALNKEDLV
ncbi:hypothetical protein Ahy_A07g035127 [Arachis hypogaea]|uniref:Putative plant transposon protein domain-containing protein n=1 Tax=Arachis hypogaea TaxID=3818 RepID=A0A445CDD0_ARAHY|nr:hypothetical protein Ahy_A07g035127 [Arachis hypogaea]